MPRVSCRAYADLNDFLLPGERGRPVLRDVGSHASAKDIIESIGIPHPEVDLIVVNGTPVGFGAHLRDGDRMAVFPRFRSIAPAAAVRLHRPPPRPVRFVADVNLGRLAARLRLAGFDVVRVDDDADVARVAAFESRAVLTRDRDLLKRRTIASGRWVRHTQPDDQFVEVLGYFDLAGDMRPFTRCLRCNAVLESVGKAEVMAALPPRVLARCDEFHRCPACRRVYWRGSHVERLRERLRSAAARSERGTMDAERVTHRTISGLSASADTI